MTNKEFFLALDDLEREKRIDKQEMIETLQNALVFAYKKHTGNTGRVFIKTNPEKFTVKFYAVKNIVEEVVDPETEISLEDARLIKKSYKVGETVDIEFIPKEFGRIAAQTAKQVVFQKLREKEKDNSIQEYEDKENEIQSCIVRRIDESGNVYVELGGSVIDGVMLPQDQVEGEKYNVNDKITVYVKKVKSGGRVAQVLVSRTATGLVKKLFENEVPEIAQGQIVIKAVSREAGQRSKIAIYSEDKTIDAVGACVGTKGMRVNAVVEELHGEKIDIILWSEDPLEYIAKALSPAQVLKVSANEGEKVARVVVPDDKLSLAIGKNGQNARLAARLTGWKIDVKSESKALEEESLELEAMEKEIGEKVAEESFAEEDKGE